MSYKSEICFSKQTDKPLTTYESEEEASDGANYANINYGNDLSSYHCSKCSNWHLSPSNRMTKSVKCRDCDDRNGKMKDLYETKVDAQRRADILFEEKGVLLSIYECPFSSGWHLTKSKV